MASKQAIAAALKGLAANYRISLDPDLPDIWLLGLQDVDDEALMQAVGKIVARERFFPTIAVVRDALGLNRLDKPDTDGILARIWQLANYHPQWGTTPPSVGTVREHLGETIGDAYALVTGDRLFNGNQTGRDIARREFADDLTTAAENGYSVALPAPNPVPMLASGPVIYDDAPQRGGFKRIGA